MLNIAIDGPAGAGKTTVAKAVAKRLKILYLDTGAMYRGVAVYCINRGADVCDESAVKPLLDGLRLEVLYGGGDGQRIVVNGEDVTPFIREHRISKASSDVSALPSVRLKMVDLQRRIAAASDLVLDGRDIGTFVLPEARYKFFLSASPEERARRRFDELKSKGTDIVYGELLEDIKKRDYNDSHRALAPLKCADDAVYIDTSALTPEEVVEAVLSHIKA
ncbi:MAG: (d)CMP kinase [Clostridiaceae bacterium]|jgi:cytidylate kinase|nr:(d)CMP kinase [Clostridiaceae bacterium]